MHILAVKHIEIRGFDMNSYYKLYECKRIFVESSNIVSIYENLTYAQMHDSWRYVPESNRISSRYLDVQKTHRILPPNRNIECENWLKFTLPQTVTIMESSHRIQMCSPELWISTLSQCIFGLCYYTGLSWIQTFEPMKKFTIFNYFKWFEFNSYSNWHNIVTRCSVQHCCVGKIVLLIIINYTLANVCYRMLTEHGAWPAFQNASRWEPHRNIASYRFYKLCNNAYVGVNGSMVF